MACRHLHWSELGKYFNLMSMLMLRRARAAGAGETLLMVCGPPALSGLVITGGHLERDHNHYCHHSHYH